MSKKNSILKTGSVILASFILIAAAFAGGMYVGFENRPAIEKVRGILNPETGQPREVDFNLFWEVWSRLEEHYVDRADIDREKLVDGAIAGMVRALGDPYTTYFPPPEAKEFAETVKGSFGGIGAEIGMRKGVVTVISPLKDSPAEKAGVLAGDQILRINATSTEELTLDQAIGFIRGEVGTSVKLTVLRTDTPKEIEIVRDTIRIPILETALKGSDIFYIHLFNFSEQSANQFRDALKEYQRSGASRLVLDLRGNPGGYLEAAIDMASWFIPAGDVVARERFAEGEDKLYRSYGYGLFEKTPMVVLIDQGSASASEILAGALRDNRGIKLIGMKSFGKGSVQTVEDLDDGSSLKITIAKWLTPNSISIDEKGLEPDIAVEVTPKDTEGGKDPQLEKAIETVRSLP